MGIEAAKNDAVGLQCEGLVQCSRTPGNAALAVQHSELPANGSGSILYPLADPQYAAVAQIRGDKQHLLVGLSRRTGDRPIPVVPRLSCIGDPLLGLFDEIIGKRRHHDRQGKQSGDQGATENRQSHSVLLRKSGKNI
ncbi:hypothetical protein D3C75_933910 [compost metagenome]